MKPSIQSLLGAPLLVAFALLAGCASQPPIKPDPQFNPAMPPEASEHNPVQSNGAIFQTGQVDNMFADSRPYRVGDILTVLLEERMQASKSAQTSTGKSQETAITPPNILGLTGPAIERLNAQITGERDFAGDGASSQQNTLNGQITVTVARVLSNGNLVIRGQKWIGINQGSEFIKLAGMVRPQDIAADNTVMSSRVANAQIAYGGEGVINESNNMGWMARFFNSPIFPF
ncbi:flagellar basal body L-ring protein FlgH [Guyparkeria halopsychrophila]|uniref:flagellar basal body L-ring protein FlgH n=1 Tax=Guyparkeria halopsychrophila TaxID=3139421 RepID=UPI0037C536C2